MSAMAVIVIGMFTVMDKIAKNTDTVSAVCKIRMIVNTAVQNSDADTGTVKSLPVSCGGIRTLTNDVQNGFT